jgi:hypothetical protein
VKVAKVALQTAAVGLVCLLIGLLGWQVVQRERGRHLVADIHSGTRPPAPALELERLRADAGRLSLTSLRGKIVVLNFWASWCQPCKDESPLLEKTWQRRAPASLDDPDTEGLQRPLVERATPCDVAYWQPHMIKQAPWPTWHGSSVPHWAKARCHARPRPSLDAR